MDVRESIRTELSFRRDEMCMPLRAVLQDVTRNLTEKEWEVIEIELNRAIR